MQTKICYAVIPLSEEAYNGMVEGILSAKEEKERARQVVGVRDFDN